MITDNYTLSISGNYPNWLLIIGMVLALAFSVWTYLRTIPPVRTSYRFILITTRCLAIWGGLILLHHTVIESHRKVMSPASISILLDRSSSMSITQGNLDRKQQVDSIFATQSFNELSNRYNVNIWTFDDSLSTTATNIQEIISSSPIGVGTNISRAWMELNEKTIANPPDLTLIISDGAHNSGPDPIRHIRSSSTPVWTVGIGSDQTYRDAMLLQVISNPVVYQGSKNPIEIGYRVVGITNEMLEITIRDREDRLLVTRKVNLAQSGKHNLTDSGENSTIEGNIEIDLDITEIGKQRFTVSIKNLADEIVTDNNSRSFYVNALSHKMKVLLIAGTPNNSLSNLVRILSVDEHIELIQRTTKGRSFYEGNWPDDKLLAEADVVLFHDFPGNKTPTNQLTELLTKISEAELPVAYFDGSGISRKKLSLLADLFAFSVTNTRTKLREGRLKPIVHHAIIAEPEDIAYEQKWDGKPPLKFSTSKIKINKDNIVLAEFITENGSSTFPGIVISESRGTKSAIVMAHDLWKWSLNEESSDPILQPLISRLIRWLAVRKAGKRVEVKLAKDLYSSREQIKFTVNVLNENYLPLDDAIVTAKFSFADTVGGVTMLKAGGNGKYHGSFHSWGEGEYSINVSASRNEQFIGKDKGQISVEAFNIELLDSRMNRELLTAIGASANGGYIPASEIDSFFQSIDIPSKEKQIDNQWILWGSGWLLGIIILLLSIEWFIRITNGLL